MAQKRWALSLPLDGFTLAEHADIAREAEGLGYTDAWSLEIDGVDCFAPLAVAAMATEMRIGTAIANVFTRPGEFCPGTPDPDTSNNEAIDSISILDTSDLRVNKFALSSNRSRPISR